MLYPYLVSMLFADLLSLHVVTFLMFILFHVTFFSSSYMLEPKFAMYYRAGSLHSQASYAVLAEESLTRPGFLRTFPTQHTTVFLIQHSCVIITFRC